MLFSAYFTQRGAYKSLCTPKFYWAIMSETKKTPAQKRATRTDDNRRSSFQIFQLINISKSIRGCTGFTNPGIFINYCLRTWLGVFLMDLIQIMAIYSQWTFIVNTELLVLNVQNRLRSTCLKRRWTLKWFICLTNEFYGHAHVSHPTDSLHFRIVI